MTDTEQIAALSQLASLFLKKIQNRDWNTLSAREREYVRYATLFSLRYLYEQSGTLTRTDDLYGFAQKQLGYLAKGGKRGIRKCSSGDERDYRSAEIWSPQLERRCGQVPEACRDLSSISLSCLDSSSSPHRAHQEWSEASH